MTNALTAAASRTLTAARIDQGFTSQAQLDAFFAYYDHTTSCTDCLKPGPMAWMEGDASWQPTASECAHGRALHIAYSTGVAR